MLYIMQKLLLKTKLTNLCLEEGGSVVEFLKLLIKFMNQLMNIKKINAKMKLSNHLGLSASMLT
jgi:hypothetical protein